MITLYNTLTRRKESFIPIEDGKVKMYVCGPTVYDVPHVGHARSAYVFDVIRRYFEYRDFNVCLVRNITDVDDKIIKKALSELEEMSEGILPVQLKLRTKEVVKRYLDIYHREMDVLGIKPPSVEPKATENIPKMIEFIKRLIDKGAAYVAGGSVYFSVENFPGYGKLSHQHKDEMLSGVRIEPDENKKYPLDFALWKEAKETEPFWESPWGKGRPGWHIECSVMSTALLGEEFDIHGGGLDLIFPHHENEIAQAQAATGKKFANYWMHNGLLTVEGEKMSKSLGNYITISDFLEKYKDADLLKISFLMSHYRSPMDYCEEKMKAARNSKERILIFFDKVKRLGKNAHGRSKENTQTIIMTRRIMADLQEAFNKAMDDDFNTPEALSVIFEAVKIGNDHLADPKFSAEEKLYIGDAVKNYILRAAEILGLSLNPLMLETGESKKIEELVKSREEARLRKDYSASDRIRKELADLNVVVEDTPEGPVWRMK